MLTSCSTLSVVVQSCTRRSTPANRIKLAASDAYSNSIAEHIRRDVSKWRLRQSPHFFQIASRETNVSIFYSTTLLLRI